MIYINLDGKQPPAKWRKKAQALSKLIDAAGSYEEKYRLIKKHEDLWRELKKWLMDQSQNKCWYTEARNDSAHFEVEHFRPKGWSDDSFEGYWWLAFDWTNYRLCGNSPNRKKGAFFPLHPDSRRASSEKRHMVDDEMFCLLDPIDPSDPLLLSFNETGDAIPNLDIKGWERERAEVSILRYGLNDLPQLCEGRRKIWQECRAILDDLYSLHERYQKEPTATCRTRITEKTKQLRAKLTPDQPFSAVARKCLVASGIPWAQDMAGL